MVCAPHRTALLGAMYAAKTALGLPGIKVAPPPKPVYAKQAPVNKGYQGSDDKVAPLYGERSTGGMYNIASTPAMSFFQPFQAYKGEQKDEHQHSVGGDPDLEQRLPEIPRVGYVAIIAYQPIQADVQAHNPSYRSRDELTKLFVEERNRFLEEKADGIDKILNEPLALYYPDVQH